MSQTITRFALAFLALCFCAALCRPVALAQSQKTGKVSGKVQDIDTQQGIPGVVVTMVNLKTKVLDARVTNAEGYYSFNFVMTGDYQLSSVCKGAPACAGYEVIRESELPIFSVDLRVNN